MDDYRLKEKSLPSRKQLSTISKLYRKDNLQHGKELGHLSVVIFLIFNMSHA